MSEPSIHCRGCFESIKKYEKTSQLKDKLKNKEVTFAQILSECFGLSLDSNSLEQDVICTSCRKKVINFINFKELVFETDKKFKELRNDLPESVEVEVKIEYMKTEVDVWDADYTGSNDNIIDDKDDEEKKNFDDTILEKRKVGRPRTRKEKPKKIKDHKIIRRHRKPQREENLKLYKKNDEGMYECPKETCPGIFKNLGYLEMHLENKHPDTDQKIFTCETCGEEFLTLLLHKRHVYKFHTPRPYTCDICGSNYPFIESLRNHIYIHMKDRKPEKPKCACTICGKLFGCQSNMLRHRKEVHFPKELLPKPYICNVCGSQWATKSKLSAHMKNHDNPEFFCDICSKGFSLKGALALHVLTHTTARPFFCDICGKTYKTKYQLRDHQMSHNEERTLKCSMCPATFKLINSLRTHESQVHISTGPISCEECGKLCKNKSSLKTHLILHSKREINCPHCDKSYKIMDTLKRHVQRVHLGLKKRHECSVCFKNLWSRKHIADHIEEAHKDEIIARGKTADELVTKYWTSDPSGANLGEVPPKGIPGRPLIA